MKQRLWMIFLGDLEKSLLIHQFTRSKNVPRLLCGLTHQKLPGGVSVKPPRCGAVPTITL